MYYFKVNALVNINEDKEIEKMLNVFLFLFKINHDIIEQMFNL